MKIFEMKICKRCKNPKFDWQMDNYNYLTYMGGVSFKLKVCKKCVKYMKEALKEKIWNGEEPWIQEKT